jgi:hypothetical protein
MQRLRKQQGVMGATAIGLVLLGGVSYALAAEEPKKPTEQAVPPAASKAPAAKKDAPEKKAPEKKASEQKATEKKAPQKKAAAKGEGRKAKPAAGPTAPVPAPTYTSAETAATAQACYGEAPKIESMMPDEGKAGDKVTISGRNFGPAECLRSLSFGPGYPATFKFESDTQITGTVPSGRRNGLAMLTVTTASGEDSKVFVVK